MGTRRRYSQQLLSTFAIVKAPHFLDNGRLAVWLWIHFQWRATNS
jgi:hypothetical protein